MYGQVLRKRRKYEEIMIRYEWVKTFNEEDDRLMEKDDEQMKWTFFLNRAGPWVRRPPRAPLRLGAPKFSYI